MKVTIPLLCVSLLAFWRTSAVYGQNAPGTAQAGTPVPATPPSLQSAQQLYRRGKFAEAAQVYQILIDAGSDPGMAYAKLAEADLKLRKNAEAFAVASKAIELAPTYPAAQVALGEVYFRQGKIDDAEREFLTLARAGTQYARAYLGLAQVYRAASYYKQAQQMIQVAHQLDPTDRDISAWIGTLSPWQRIVVSQEQPSGGQNRAGSHDESRDANEVANQLRLLQEKISPPEHPCRLVTKTTAMQGDLTQLFSDGTHLRGFGLKVRMNGIPSTLMLDTGAGGILINRKIAEKAGIKRIAQAVIVGIGDQGNTAGYLGYADSIKIGGLEFHDCYVEVMDKNSVGDDEGLIGADVFSNFLVDLNFSEGKFKLSELPLRPGDQAPAIALEPRPSEDAQAYDRYVAPEMRSFSPLLRVDHVLLIPTRVNDSAPMLFMLDTGAFNNSISPDAASRFTKVYSDADTRITGLNGNIKEVFRASQFTLQFANLKQSNQDTVAFDNSRISNSIGIEVSGILGFATLRMLDMQIDYRDGLIRLNFDANRWR